MAFDLEYLSVHCAHKIYGEPIYTSDLLTYKLVYSGGYYGSAKYGSSVYGPDYYSYTYSGIKEMGFINGIEYAILTPQNTMAGEVRLFYKDPNQYVRTTLPPKKSILIQKNKYSGAWYVGGDDLNYITDLLTIPTYKANTTAKPISFSLQGLVFTIPANSILIFIFDRNKTWEVDYVTLASECPYCSGTGYTNDIAYTTTGALALVRFNDKLAQTVTKGVVSTKGKNPYFPSYGTSLNDMLGNKDLYNAWLVRSEIYGMLNDIKAFHAYISAIHPGFLSPNEILENILNIDIKELDGGYRLQMMFTLLCRAGTEVITKPLTLYF